MRNRETGMSEFEHPTITDLPSVNGTPGENARALRAMGLIMGFVGIAVLGLVVLLSPRHLVYDELAHISNVFEVHRIGWIATLTSASNISAAGPLFTAIHFICEPWTKLSAPAIRLPNFILFVGVLLVFAKTVQLLQIRDPALAALSIIAVPFLWPAAGMALTEIPALFCYAASVWICVNVEQAGDRVSVVRICLALMGGILLGLACLGRQTYLATLFALPFLCQRDPKTWLPPALIVFSALSVCGWLFWVWGGFVPPSLKSNDAGLHYSHGVLSFSYLALATLFLAPKWLLFEKGLSRKELVLIYAVGLGAAILALAYPIAEIVPARTLMGRILTPSVFAWYPRVISALLAGLAAIWMMRFARELWLYRDQRVWLFIHLSLLVLALTPIKISHQFSSRYVVTDIALLVLLVWKRHDPISWVYGARVAFGTFIGAMILRTYFV